MLGVLCRLSSAAVEERNSNNPVPLPSMRPRWPKAGTILLFRKQGRAYCKNGGFRIEVNSPLSSHVMSMCRKASTVDPKPLTLNP